MGGEIPKGDRARRARSLGIWPLGGEITGGRNPWDTGSIPCCHFRSKTNDSERPDDRAALPFVCFAPAAQTRMTVEEATIAKLTCWLMKI